jgi:hypothetical protein
MKQVFAVVGIGLMVVSSQAQNLSFTSGVVSNFSNVTLSLQGPTNQVVEVQRLNRTNQTWDAMGTVRLSSVGSAAFNTTLHEGIYGFYRAKTTNNTYYSTNAFGAVAGTLDRGQVLIGNPFGPVPLTSLIPSPVEGTIVYRWDNPGGWAMATYDLGEWDTNLTIGSLRGILVRTPTNVVSQRYLVSGLITTNLQTQSVPSGSSLLCSPVYKLVTPSQWIADELTTNRLGGYSSLPVQTSGSNPQCQIFQMVDTAGTYMTSTLTSSNQWQTGGSNTVVKLELTEGFWLSKPTNATWNVSVPIW